MKCEYFILLVRIVTSPVYIIYLFLHISTESFLRNIIASLCYLQNMK